MNEADREGAIGGHGATAYRGRSASGDAAGVRRAMDRLLELGGIAPRSERTALATGGVVHHLESGSGRAVVLLHGASGGGANWYRLIGPLARRYRVLAPDLPGFGLSPARAETPPLGMAAARVVEEWLSALRIDTAIVIGTSFGGLAGLRLAQRAAARVAGLVLIDTVGLGRELPWLVRALALPPLSAALRRPSRAGVAFVLDRLVTAGPNALPAEDRSALLEYLVAVERLGAARVLAQTLPRFASLRGQREVLAAPELRRIERPTLIVWGERDGFLPVEHGRRAAAAMSDAELAVLGGAGHSPNWECPDRLLARLEPFLDGIG